LFHIAKLKENFLCNILVLLSTEQILPGIYIMKLYIHFLGLFIAFVLSSYISNNTIPFSTGENSFVMLSEDNNSVSIKIDVKASDFKTSFYNKGTYNYLKEKKNVELRVFGKGTEYVKMPYAGINIDFNKFDSTGTYIMDSTTVLTIFFKKHGNSNGLSDRIYVLDGKGEVVLSRYGKVGEVIEGTFTGTFNRMDYDATMGIYIDKDEMVTIKDGKFSVVRYPDFHWNEIKSSGAEPTNFKGNNNHKEDKKH
jgi:hypothetical protein